MNTIIRLLCDGDGSTQKRFAVDGLMALGETVTLQFEGLPENMAGKPVKMAAWLQESNECIWIAEGALSLKKAETKDKNAKPIYTMNVTAPASQEAIAAFQQTDAPFIGIALTAIVGTADLGFALTRLYRGSNWREVIPADLDKPTWYTDLKAMYETVVDAKAAVIKLEENVVDKHGEVVQMHEDVVTKHDDMMPKYDDFVVKHEEIYELKAATDENAAATAADVVSIAGAAEIAIFSANIAAAAREEAKTSATNANASATSASASASNASTSATTATTAKNEAVQARDEAQQLLSTKADQIIFPCGVSIGSDEEKGHAIDGSQVNIGKGSLTWGQNSIAIGYNAKAYSPVNVVIGKDCSTTSGGFVRNVIIGAESRAEKYDGVAIGVGHILTEDGEIAIGAGDNMAGGIEATEAAKANTIRVKGGVLTVGGNAVALTSDIEAAIGDINSILEAL